MKGSGATFSPCRTYRYHLWREWESANEPQRCLFVMLNPSTADAEKDDPTVAKCGRFARAWGFDGLEVVNIFALRSTDPRALLVHPEPVGGLENDAFILGAADNCRGRIIAAWGNWGRIRGRGLQVYEMLVRAGYEPLTFRVTNEGQPEHPLYQPKARTPVLFRMEGARL